jgi:YVTN family beta-propeller protein
VEVVNANTFVSEYTLNDVKLPRFFTTFNGKGYLTEWVSFTGKGRVSVVNLQSHTVETTITTDVGADGIVAAGGKLFVSNNFTNTVSVINPSNNEVTKEIEVEGSPAGFVTDKDNKIWVVCTGGSDANYNPLNDGTLHRINPATSEVDKTIELNLNVSGRITINKLRDVIYYFKGKKIYQVSITATTASQDALINETNAVGFYGIGFDTKNEIIYAADAKGFAVGNGVVYRYSKDGTFIDSFDSGRGPNGFIFR